MTDCPRRAAKSAPTRPAPSARTRLTRRSVCSKRALTLRQESGYAQARDSGGFPYDPIGGTKPRQCGIPRQENPKGQSRNTAAIFAAQTNFAQLSAKGI